MHSTKRSQMCLPVSLIFINKHLFNIDALLQTIVQQKMSRRPPNQTNWTDTGLIVIHETKWTAVKRAHLMCLYFLITIPFLAKNMSYLFNKPQHYITFSYSLETRVILLSCIKMPVAVFCITVSSFTDAEHLTHKCPGEQWMHPYLCHMRSVAHCQEARHPVLSQLPSPRLCFVGVRGKGDLNLTLIEVLVHKRIWYSIFAHYHWIPTIQLGVWDGNVGPPAADPHKLLVSARWNIDLKLSWPLLLWWVMVLGCSSSSLLSCFHALKGMRRLAVTVTVNINMLYAHIIKGGRDLLTSACIHACGLTQASLNMSLLDVGGQTLLKFRPCPSLTPSQYSPGLGWFCWVSRSCLRFIISYPGWYFTV